MLEMVLQVPQGIRRAINKKNKRPVMFQVIITVFGRLKLTDVEKRDCPTGQEIWRESREGEQEPEGSVEDETFRESPRKASKSAPSKEITPRGDITCIRTEGMCRAPSRQFPNKGPDLLVKY